MSVECQQQTHALQDTPSTGCSTLIDHLVGVGDERRRHVEAQRLGGFEVDRQLELGRKLNWKISRFFTSQDATTRLVDTYRPGQCRRTSGRHARPKMSMCKLQLSGAWPPSGSVKKVSSRNSRVPADALLVSCTNTMRRAAHCDDYQWRPPLFSGRPMTPSPGSVCSWRCWPTPSRGF